MSSWVEHCVWWHIYPLGFLGADTSGVDRTAHRPLDGLVGWLDYAVELGASGIALGPIFASDTHGYDTVDHFTIDERLGDGDSFARLVAACRARGLRLMLDGVFNHVGPHFPRYERALSGAGDAGWFLPRADAEPPFATFEGHPGLITLNHADSEVVDHVVDVMVHWLDAGADAWRLDAAYAVSPAFWDHVLPRVWARHPEVYIVGEVIHGDYAQITAAAGFDSLTQYELWKAVWSSLDERNLFELAWAVERHDRWLDTVVPMTFLGNHDVTRLASRIADERHLGHAVAILLTLAGTPSIYYGDEQAFRGIKEERVGGDDAVRPAFPAGGPGELAPFGGSFYRLHQLLIGFRRRHPWLHTARSSTIVLTNTLYVYESRLRDERIVVALNIGDDVARVELAPDLGSVLQAPGPPVAALVDRHLVLPGHRWAIVHP